MEKLTRERMFECADCKSIFADSEIKRIRHSDGDAWDECPFCGCDELDEVAQCYLCGEWHKMDELRNEVCDDCIDDVADKVYEVIEYAECYCTSEQVRIAPLYLKAFTASQINDIVASAFTQLPEEAQKKVCRELIDDDPYCFTEWMKGDAESWNG